MNLTQCKHQIVQTLFEQRNWRVVKSDEENMNCDLLFTWMADDFELFSKLRPYQKINHFPGIICLAKKSYLAQHLRKMKSKFPLNYDFFPDTFCLPFDRPHLVKSFEKKRRNTFILKPEFSAEGRGIRLVRRLDEIDS